METIWEYLTSKGFTVVPRGEKKTVHLVLEQEKLNPTQKSRMKLRGIAMEKLDGVYALVTYVDGEVRHWGRSGKALQNTEVLAAKVKLGLKLIDENLMFSSEVTSDDPLAKLSGYMTPARVNDTDFTPTNMEDNFFDVISLEEFIEGKSETSYRERLEDLKGLLFGTSINRIPYLFMSFGNAHRLAKSYWKEKKEGVVYSQLDSLWIAGKRDESRIKFKEKLSFECTVVGMASGKKGSKYENMMGKLIVAFRTFGNPDGANWVEVPISGVTDEQRQLWWTNPELILMQTVKVDAKSYTETGNLREPRYKETRNDKSSDFPVVCEDTFEVFYKAQATYRMLKWQGLPVS